jgi:hypothetical protein
VEVEVEVTVKVGLGVRLLTDDDRDVLVTACGERLSALSAISVQRAKGSSVK